MIAGLDVSHWQGVIDWPAVAGSGVRFAIVKATEGEAHVDKRFAANWRGAGDSGLVRGAYHYYRPERDPVKQARHFAATVGPLGPLDLPLVLDVEERGPAGVRLADRISRLRACIGEVRARSGRDPIIYTGPAFWRSEYGNADEFAGLPLWIAHYTRDPAPATPPGWAWTFWQWTNAGRVPGLRGDCDLNWYRDDDLNALFRLAGVDIAKGAVT
ncbi:MAG: glycoside hydrolase family 25 protein [Lentisphaeria bacterium]